MGKGRTAAAVAGVLGIIVCALPVLAVLVATRVP